MSSDYKSGNYIDAESRLFPLLWSEHMYHSSKQPKINNYFIVERFESWSKSAVRLLWLRVIKVPSANDTPKAIEECSPCEGSKWWIVASFKNVIWAQKFKYEFRFFLGQHSWLTVTVTEYIHVYSIQLTLKMKKSRILKMMISQLNLNRGQQFQIILDY